MYCGRLLNSWRFLRIPGSFYEHRQRFSQFVKCSVSSLIFLVMRAFAALLVLQH